MSWAMEEAGVRPPGQQNPSSSSSWRSRLREECHGLQYNRITLRFTNAQTEDSFASRRADRVTKGLQFLGWFILWLGSITYFGRSLRREDWDNPLVYEAASTAHVYDGLMALWGATLVVMAKLQQRYLLLSPTSAEVLFLMYIVVFNALTFMTDVFFLAKLAGVEDPFEGRGLNGRDRDNAWWALMCFGIVQASHTIIPFRWTVVSFLEPTALLFYAVPTFLIGNGGILTMATLVLMVVLASYGCRSLERQEREAFCQLIKEKTLRTQAEFVLDLSEIPAGTARRQSASRDRNQSRHVAGSGDGRAESEVSSTVFRDHGAPSMHQRLRSMMEIGKRERWLLQTMHMELKPTTLEQGSRDASTKTLVGELHGTPVLVKLGWAADPAHMRAALPTLLNEIRALRQVRHPNITLFHGVCIDLEECVLAVVTERKAGVALGEWVQQGCAPSSHRRFGETTQIAKHRVLAGIGSALRYLHEHQPVLVHGDLRETSVLINEMGRPKLSSFGSATVLTKDSRLLGGAPAPERVPWMAPEMLVSRKVSPPTIASDVFSFGRIVHFIITGRNVAEYCSNQKITSLARNHRVPALPWPDGSTATRFTGQCKALSQRCSNAKASERPAAFQILEDLRAWPMQFIQEEPYSSSSSNPDNSRADWSGAHEDIVRLVGWRAGLQQVKNLGSGAQSSRSAQSSRREEDKWLGLDSVLGNNKRRSGMPVKNTEFMPSIDEGGEEEAAESSGQHVDTVVTGLVTRQLMLIDVARSWKLAKQAGCCSYHIALRELHKVSRDLCAAACVQQFQHCAGRQCPNCLALAEKEDASFEPSRACDFCGQEWPTAADAEGKVQSL